MIPIARFWPELILRHVLLAIFYLKKKKKLEILVVLALHFCAALWEKSLCQCCCHVFMNFHADELFSSTGPGPAAEVPFGHSAGVGQAVSSPASRDGCRSSAAARAPRPNT